MKHFLKNYFIFFILPLLYLAFAAVYRYKYTFFYTSQPDPVYAYLMNGTNLASGHLEIGHFDHPGTPVQCLAAIIIFIKHFISGSGPLYQDVLLHPENYLLVCSIIMILITGFTIYFTGRFVYKNTGNVSTAILFQLTPMLTKDMLKNIMYLMPEAIIIPLGTFFMAYLYVHFVVNQSDEDKPSEYRTLIICGLITGFLIATKINTTLIIIVPLFLIKGVRQRLTYLLVTLVAFIVLVIPVMPKYYFFYKWVRRIVTHDSLYGSGKEQFIDAHLYSANLKELFTTDVVFTTVYAIITIAFIITIIKFMLKKKPDGAFTRALIGVWVFTTLLIFTVAKHYKFYYVFPAGTSLALGLIAASGILFNSLQKTKNIIAYCFLGGMLLLQANSYIKDANNVNHDHQTLAATRKFIETRKNIPVIIASTYQSAYIELALNFGIVYTGNQIPFYMQFEKTIHPTSYLYDVDFKKLLFWGKEMITPEVLSKYDSLLAYTKDRDSNAEREIMQEITTYNGLKLGDYKLIYRDTNTGENIYVIYTHRGLASKLLENKTSIYCDLEKLTDDKSSFIASDGKHLLAKAFAVTQKEHHSGLNAVLLNDKNQYGADLIFNVKPGDFIDATVWRKSPDGGGIVLSAEKPEMLYRGGEFVINTAENGWEQIECKCKVPDDYKEPTVHFYLFYPGKEDVYFDDINITIYSMALNSTNIFCNLEKLTNDKSQFISDDGNYTFLKADQVITTEHHSGKNSIHLSQATPYGLDLFFNVKPGDSVSASVWRKSSSKTPSIVLSAAKDQNYFYTGGNTVINIDTTGWEQIQLTIKIPQDYKESALHFYVFLCGIKDAYIDDVSISVYPAK